MEKFINDISQLNLGRRIGGGSCSEIFEMTPGVYFKKFCEDYADLSDPINLEFFKVIKTISDIDSLPNIVRANDIYRSESQLFGYSMDKVDALELEKVSDSVLVRELMNGFEELKPSIRTLSSNFVKTEDIGGDNILFNGKMYLLDLDLSLVDKRYIPDELYEATRRSVFESLFQRISGSVITEKVVDDDYVSYMNNLIDVCSNFVDKEVSTIGDFKKAYCKVYRN